MSKKEELTLIKENIKRINSLFGDDIAALTYTEMQRRMKKRVILGASFSCLILPIELVKYPKFTVRDLRAAGDRFYSRGINIFHPANGEYITDGVFLIKDRGVAEKMRRKIGIDTSIDRIPEYHLIVPEFEEDKYVEISSTGYGCYTSLLLPCEIFIGEDRQLTLLNRKYSTLLRQILGRVRFYRKPFEGPDPTGNGPVVAVEKKEIKGVVMPVVPLENLDILREQASVLFTL